MVCVRMSIRDLLDVLRTSLWLVPAGGTLAAAALAVVLIGASAWIGDQAGELPLIFEAGADGARAMLQAIATSVITVAGVVFSVTIVALQLTSTQFSPRVLRNFLSDRPQQWVLAVFMGTFIYSLLVLRSIESPGAAGDGGFVPRLAVSGALVLAFASLAALIYFVHHISVRIGVDSIITSVTEETEDTIEELHRDIEQEAGVERQLPATPFEGGATVRVAARRNGYVRLMAIGSIVRAAADRDLRVQCQVAPGDWVLAGAPLFAVAPGSSVDEEARTALVDKVVIGGQRSMSQDAAFGFQQLVDIAVKALSPGINDPTTASQCLDRLAQLLVDIGHRPDLPSVLQDADGAPRVWLRFPGFEELVRHSVGAIRQHAAGSPIVLAHLGRTLATVAVALPAERAPVLRVEAATVATVARGIEPQEDREAILAALADLAR